MITNKELKPYVILILKGLGRTVLGGILGLISFYLLVVSSGRNWSIFGWLSQSGKSSLEIIASNQSASIIFFIILYLAAFFGALTGLMHTIFNGRVPFWRVVIGIIPSGIFGFIFFQEESLLTGFAGMSYGVFVGLFVGIVMWGVELTITQNNKQ